MADLSVKYAAYLAGLGSYGVNSLLLTPDHGPRVRLTAVLTNAELEPTGPSLPFADARCNDCLRCVPACPVRAINPDGVIDRQKCSEYMFTKLGGLRCGLCLKACPL
jgi:epoxyqueuosine reductase QueG